VRRKLTKLFGTNCRHPQTIVVRSAGMERIVCESCGHISFSFDGAGPYPLDADRVEPDLIQTAEAL